MNKSLILAAALAGVALPVALAARDEQAGSRDLDWSYSEDRLEISSDGSHATLDSNGGGTAFTTLRRLGDIGSPISFTLDRQAGTIACTGKVVDDSEAEGTCRFTPKTAFVEGLAARALPVADDDDLLGMTLVDAQLATIDDFRALGFTFDEADKLVAVTALGVSLDYAARLKDAGLAAGDLDELISAKALGIDASWVREMAEAGYPGLNLDQAIELRALGVTPDYARRMARVLLATEGK